MFLSIDNSCWILSRKRRRNSCESFCESSTNWSKEEATLFLNFFDTLSVYFLSQRLSNKLAKDFVSGLSKCRQFSRKNSRNGWMLLRHWTTALIKQEFPWLAMPTTPGISVVLSSALVLCFATWMAGFPLDRGREPWSVFLFWLWTSEPPENEFLLFNNGEDLVMDMIVFLTKELRESLPMLGIFELEIFESDFWGYWGEEANVTLEGAVPSEVSLGDLVKTSDLFWLLLCWAKWMVMALLDAALALKLRERRCGDAWLCPGLA